MSDEAGVLDFAGIDSTSAAVDTDVQSAAADTNVETTVESTEVDTTKAEESAAPKEKQQYDSSGQPKEDAAKVEVDDPKEFGEKTPQEVRKALKAFKDANPANAGMVKQLHGAYERWEAAKAIYPGGVNEMRQAKEFADLIGGAEGYEKLTGTVQAAEASDAQLYSGDPQLIENIVSDLKSNGKLDALGKLAPSFIDAVKANSNDVDFQKVIAPHILSGLHTANLPNTVNYLSKILSDPDPAKALAGAKEVASDIKGWLDGLEENTKKAKENVVSPERKKLDEERAAFLKEQSDFKSNQTEEFKNNVAKSCESVNNKSLGSELAPFLKMPFFKGFGRENLMPLGNTIKAELYSTLKADGAYQAQMKAMWGAKTPDRAKIEEYHKARVDSISKELVRNVVQKMYPGYAKGGAAAGRVAAATEKKVAQTKVETKAVETGKPIYVAVKPKDLDRTRKDSTILEITGKGYLPNGKFVTWRK